MLGIEPLSVEEITFLLDQSRKSSVTR